jgi:U3 small nucleolar RNA-associated protein 21
MLIDFLVVCRANRAQYGEVSFQTVAHDDIIDVSLPSMQGAAEDEGVFSFPTKTIPQSDVII